MDSEPLSFATLLAGTIARWRAVFWVTVATIVAALVLSFALPPTYRAATSFVTAGAGIQLPQGLADLANGAGLSGMASQLAVGTGKDPSISPAFYEQLLDSRELLTRIVESRFPDPRAPGDSATLVEIFRIRSQDPNLAVETAVRTLRRAMRVSVNLQTGLVTLQTDARWQGLSAEIANRAVRFVSAFNKEQRYTRARAKREFLEGRVREAQTELRATEDSLQSLYERNRLWESSPALVVEERRRRRQVETTNALYLSLRQQYETARIDEVNDTPVITVVDRAVPPTRRQWPQRKLILLTAAFLGVTLGLIGAAALELARHWARVNPDQAELLRTAARQFVREVASALPGGKDKRVQRDFPS